MLNHQTVTWILREAGFTSKVETWTWYEAKQYMAAVMIVEHDYKDNKEFKKVLFDNFKDTWMNCSIEWSYIITNKS